MISAKIAITPAKAGHPSQNQIRKSRKLPAKFAAPLRLMPRSTPLRYRESK
jgi:hypothetical protein